MLNSISLYCERASTAFWAEPFNAVSNIGFLAAAAAAAVSALNRNKLKSYIAFALILVCAIGIGSFCFHTFANSLTQIMDVIPIWVFVVYLIIMMLHDFLGLKWLKATLLLCAIVVTISAMLFGFSRFGMDNYLSLVPPKTLNGSLQYLPALVALYAFATVLFVRRHSARRWVGAAACVFTISLFFRTIDFSVCATFPSGTHFIWHILNAVTLWLLLESVIRYNPILE